MNDGWIIRPLRARRLGCAVLAALVGLAPATLLAQPADAAQRADAAHRHGARCDRAIGAEPFARTELFFGLSRPGGVVSEEEFKAFVDARITPRFPDGLTLLSGVGQFRDASGATIVEGSKLLILLYPRNDRQGSAKIEAIRSDYRTRFQQQSVLRTDDVSCVSF